jgi:hypothetical protein
MADQNLTSVSAYVNSFKIQIVHVPTNNNVTFAAFLNSFNDSYKTNFKSQAVYGRMDPIVNYQNTTRTLSIGFTVPAASIQESIQNLDKISNLIKFQYPVYSNVENASGISSPPICKIKFQNLANEYGDYLYGYFAGVDFVPTNESGYFIDEGNNLYAKEYKVSLSFTVLHTKAVGWSKTGKAVQWASGQYPYKNSANSSPTPLSNNDLNTNSATDSTDPLANAAQSIMSV